MGGKARRIDAKRMQVDGDLAQGLDGIGMHEHAHGVGNAHDFFQGLHRTHFVVRQHDRHEHGIWPQGLFHLSCAHESGAIRFEHGQLHAHAFEQVGRREHRLVLDGRGDDMGRECRIAGKGLLALHCGDDAEQGGIVRLGGAACEEQFVGTAADAAGKAFPRLLHRRKGPAAHAVQRVGVAAEFQIGSTSA